jgi:molybdopterin-synthase adenylyltransferase
MHAYPDPSLASRRVLVVGVGGLGSPAALALARAGVGTLELVDPDRIDVSNLHRQLLYDSSDVGRPKVTVAAERLRQLAPGVQIHAHCVRFGPADGALLDGVDCVVDGTDTVAAKFVLNDVAVGSRVPLVHAGVLGFVAQLMTVVPGASACYRCVFEEPPPPGETATPHRRLDRRLADGPARRESPLRRLPRGPRARSRKE